MATIASDFANGRFLPPLGEPLESRNPARDGEPVASIAWSVERVATCVAAAREAAPSWSKLGFDERWAHLARFREVLRARKEQLAEAIVLEIGKIRSEARVEVDSLIGRFDLVRAQVKDDLRDGVLPGFPNEALRWHPHGVVAVIGPFNFPLHLCHAHVIPALLLGNTVVMKPSEVAPLCGIRYAEAAREAGLPDGVLNVVHGLGPTGAALVAHPDVAGLAFTGSWPVGRRIAEAALDKPEMLIALEMGGKNTVVVCEDADVRQAVHEIVVGGYLTTGQRCTCTDRVLVTRPLAKTLIPALAKVVASLHFGDPDDSSAFAGPMATEAGRARLEGAMECAERAGADVIVEGARLPGGFFRSGSIHVLRAGVHDVPGYTDTELFGPDLGIEIVEDDDEAISIIGGSPYGFANSVFTSDDARFDRYYRETRCGILNRNRSTNQASPRLPFGGTGRSGNFRPAGSFAPRNLAIPVAVQSNARLSMVVHAQLEPVLPPHDLERLSAAHEREEQEEARAERIERATTITRPSGGSLPESTRWLERLYAGERVPREKKAPVFDHRRSSGPYFASVDRAPLSVLDAMSQTATLPFGFNDSALVREYVNGEFEDALIRARDISSDEGARLADEYARMLRRLVPGYDTVAFAGSGAEANEKALALCMNERPSAKKLLAFEGSFHGRTLLSLFASHSPSKRLPFEIGGYEVTFAPWPTWNTPGVEPEEPSGFREACSTGDAQALRELAHQGDPLLEAELQALTRVAELLREAPHFAVIVEPMQSEGGDRYVTARFHRGLRLLTRALEMPLVIDEVQCGFGLSGSHFAWHQGFGLVKSNGMSDAPDCVTFAKRAQVGVVMSRLVDPEPTHAFAASLIRGRLHAENIAANHAGKLIELWVKERIPTLERRFGHRIRNPRVRGFAFAFDLSSPAELDAYLGQRFWRGAIVFGAGTTTVRYRFNASFGEHEVGRVFDSILESLAWLDAHPGKKPPAWEDLSVATPERVAPAVRVAEPNEVERLIPRILELEARTYEPARRDSEARLRMGFEEGGIAVVAEEGERLIGCALAAPLERFSDVPGPDQDPLRASGEHRALYSIAVTVDPERQGQGLGKALKRTQLLAAREHGFAYIKGRNRVGEADAMSRLNDSFGAFTERVLEGQYGENAQARYYAQPVQALVSHGGKRPSSTEGIIDLSSGLITPFANPPESLTRLDRQGALAGPAVQKLTLVNYVTPAIVRAVEYASALFPELPHVYLTSGKDELVDKSVRLFRWHRKKARVVLSLEGTYVGHTTAAARSISDPALHRQGAPYFSEWTRVPHPARAGLESITALEARIAKLGADSVIGIFLESLGERSGWALDAEFAHALADLRKRTGVPVCVLETASAYGRSGVGAFASSAWDERFDVHAWATGGQLGIMHVSRAMYVGAPLTFVSTWDGDELSLIQMHHQLRASRTSKFDERMISALSSTCRKHSIELRGMGMHRVLSLGERAEQVRTRLAEHGIRISSRAPGLLALDPMLDRAEEHSNHLARSLDSVLSS